MEFVTGCLQYAYHGALEPATPGMLPAFSRALARARSSTLPSPAEIAAHPQITSPVQGCRLEIVTIETYSDGEGGRFELHPNLVREPGGWRVWSVPEASASIPLPAPQKDGTRFC